MSTRDAERNRDVVPLHPRGDVPPPLTFTRGARPPFAIRWFGSTALLGHLRHLGAEALATENRDARDWMRPQPPDGLLDEVAAALGAPGDGATLADRLGRGVWIDFVADTGDDHDVSAAVGAMLFAEYALAAPDGETRAGDGAHGPVTRVLPRGDILIFGGDTAYPVSAAEQIASRVVRPWNRILRGRPDLHVPRVLLGIPGNHDWYDGLDGFGRLFRRDAVDALASRARRTHGPGNAHADPGDDAAMAAAVGRAYRQLHLDELLGSVTLARDAIESVTAILTGRKLKRVSRLVLLGYRAVQEASYWLLPLAPGLDLWGVDRQLRALDFRQRVFFNERRAGNRTPRRILVSSDPAFAMGDVNPPGQQILKACGLRLQDDPTLYITGDSHHYERRAIGPSQHVIAGGGGSFVHGTRVHRHAPGRAPACTYPDARASRRLAASVPWQVAAGTAGLLPHAGCALLAWLQLRAFAWTPVAGWATTIAGASLAVLAMFATMSLKGRRRALAASVAVVFGVLLALLPLGVAWAVSRLAGGLMSEVTTAAVMAVAGPGLIGQYLLTLVVTGLEPWSAYAALGHPGFKHFVRLHVQEDGRVEGWVIGKDDPLAPGAPVLIDRFEW